MISIVKLVPMFAVLLPACASHTHLPPTGSFPYPVILQPSLTPARAPNEIVGSVPRPFAGVRMYGTIEAVDLVAFVEGCNLPRVDPRVSARPDISRVWYVRVSGFFSFNVMGYSPEEYYHYGYYLVSDRSGAGVAAGIFPDTLPNPPTPELGRLTPIRPPFVNR